jgi:hypothetical protein
MGFSQDKSATTARTTNETALPIFCIIFYLLPDKNRNPLLIIVRKYNSSLNYSIILYTKFNVFDFFGEKQGIFDLGSASPLGLSGNAGFPKNGGTWKNMLYFYP